jgi:hypothetical protein
MDAPLINGKRFSFSCIKLKVRSKDRVGVKSLDYDDELEEGEMRGTGPELLGTTEGDYKATGSITFFKKEFDLLIEEMGDGFYQERFDIVVFREADPGDGVSKDELIGCRLKKAASGDAQGADPSEVKCDLSIFYILRNGNTPVKNMRR